MWFVTFSVECATHGIERGCRRVARASRIIIFSGIIIVDGTRLLYDAPVIANRHHARAARDACVRHRVVRVIERDARERHGHWRAHERERRCVTRRVLSPRRSLARIDAVGTRAVRVRAFALACVRSLSPATTRDATTTRRTLTVASDFESQL